MVPSRENCWVVYHLVEILVIGNGNNSEYRFDISFDKTPTGPIWLIREITWSILVYRTEEKSCGIPNNNEHIYTG